MLRHTRMNTLDAVPNPPTSPTSRRALTDRRARATPAWRRLPVYVRTGAVVLALVTAVLVIGSLTAGSSAARDPTTLERDWRKRAAARPNEWSDEDASFQWPADARLNDFRSSESSSEDEETALRVDEDEAGERIESALFVVADEDDLLGLSAIACGLVESGQLIEVVSVGGEDALRGLDSLPCEPSGVWTATEARFPALVARADVMFVVADLLELQASLIAAGAVDVKHRHPIEGLATIVALPRDELYALGWVGTLPIDALRRASSLR